MKISEMAILKTSPQPFLIVLLALWLVTDFRLGLSQQPNSQTDAPPPIVKFNLIVTDGSKSSVDDLDKNEVQVFEDGAPQTISLFAKDTRPVQYVVAIDTSGSFKDVLGSALASVKLMIDAKKDEGEIMLLRFISSDKIETIEEFTTDKAKLIDSLKWFRIEGGQSAVNDATYIAVKSAADHKAPDSIRRAVILISDGEERASYYTTDTLINLIRVTEVQVFVVGIVNHLEDRRGLTRPSPRQKAEEFLTRVARESGGRVFFPRNNPELLEAVTTINRDLHSQYMVAYQPTTMVDKKFRKIEVKLKSSPGRKLTVFTRAGYFIIPPKLDGKKK